MEATSTRPAGLVTTQSDPRDVLGVKFFSSLEPFVNFPLWLDEPGELPFTVVEDLCRVRDDDAAELGDKVFREGSLFCLPFTSLSVWPPNPAAAAFAFAFLTSVARSGLLAVPAERRSERRFTCISASSGSNALPRSFDDDEDAPEGDGLRVSAIFGPALLLPAGVGVGGTTIGVDGCCPARMDEEAPPREDDDACATKGFECWLFGVSRCCCFCFFGCCLPPLGEGVGEPSTNPSELTSGLSFKRTVSLPSSACSKSRSVRDTLRSASRPPLSRDATGRRPPRKDDGGGMGERVAVAVLV